MDSRTLPFSPESGAHGGYKKKQGSKVHVAVDTLGQLLTLKATPAKEQGSRASGRTDGPSSKKSPEKA